MIGMSLAGPVSREPVAMPKALVTKAAVGEASIDHPTASRENVSSTTQQYTFPSRVRCSVMSVTTQLNGMRAPKVALGT